MSVIGRYAATKIIDIVIVVELNMKRLGLWKENASEHVPGSLEEWLQYTYLPFMRETVKLDVCRPMFHGVRARASKEFVIDRKIPDVERLIDLLTTLDLLSW